MVRNLVGSGCRSIFAALASGGTEHDRQRDPKRDVVHRPHLDARKRNQLVALGGTLPAFASTPTVNLGALNGAALDTSVQGVKSALGSPFQAGGSIGNTSFGALVTQWGGTTLGAATGVGTAASGNVPTVNADILVGGSAAATGNPVPITYGSGVSLPSGSNTIGAVNQGTANATPWNDNIAQFGGSTVTLGQQTAANSIPVILPSATITTLTPPSTVTTTPKAGTWSSGGCAVGTARVRACRREPTTMRRCRTPRLRPTPSPALGRFVARRNRDYPADRRGTGADAGYELHLGTGDRRRSRLDRSLLHRLAVLGERLRIRGDELMRRLVSALAVCAALALADASQAQQSVPPPSHAQVTVYTSGSGNWTVPANVGTIAAFGCGQGGGGGSGSVITGYSGGGAGGGAGECHWKRWKWKASDVGAPGASIAYSIGSGANGGAAVSGSWATAGNSGSVGASTTFGSTLEKWYGGGGGGGGPDVTYTAGGSGGSLFTVGNTASSTGTCYAGSSGNGGGVGGAATNISGTNCPPGGSCLRTDPGRLPLPCLDITSLEGAAGAAGSARPPRRLMPARAGRTEHRLSDGGAWRNRRNGGKRRDSVRAGLPLPSRLRWRGRRQSGDGDRRRDGRLRFGGDRGRRRRRRRQRVLEFRQRIDQRRGRRGRRPGFSRSMPGETHDPRTKGGPDMPGWPSGFAPPSRRSRSWPPRWRSMRRSSGGSDNAPFLGRSSPRCFGRGLANTRARMHSQPLIWPLSRPALSLSAQAPSARPFAGGQMAERWSSHFSKKGF